MHADTIDTSIRRGRKLALLALVGAMLIYAIWFFVINRRGLSTDPGDWGSFGDFVGGLLNPVIAYMAFYWLTVSVSIQRTELSETKNALLESRDAQRAQAKSTEKAMRMQAVNMQLQAIDTQLRSLYEYRSFVLEHGSGPNITYQMLTPSGKREKADELIAPLTKEIVDLQSRQQALIAQSQLIASET